ncbi:hypothetical protein HT031_006603 [Scenedesmus sp. PABB004]|nr:hypothetical protein HT031_006603 [Scenedesmus sp. PABB004]
MPQMHATNPLPLDRMGQAEGVVPGARTTATPRLTPERVMQRLAETAGLAALKHHAAFYSSELGGIVTQPGFMVLPVDDHMVHRGDAVSEGVLLVGGYLYQLDAHLARLAASAELAGLPLPMSAARLRRVLLDTAAASMKLNGMLRVWVSRGRGTFGLADAERPGLYAVLSTEMCYVGEAELDRDEGWAAVASPVDPPSPYFTAMRSTSDMPAALAQLEAMSRGADLGIFVDADGTVLRGPDCTIAMLTRDGTLVVPPDESGLAGMAARNVAALAPQHADEDLTVSAVERRTFSLEELAGAAEGFAISSELGVVGLASLDGRPIGAGAHEFEGRSGPVSLALHEMLVAPARRNHRALDQHRALSRSRRPGLLELRTAEAIMAAPLLLALARQHAAAGARLQQAGGRALVAAGSAWGWAADPRAWPVPQPGPCRAAALRGGSGAAAAAAAAWATPPRRGFFSQISEPATKVYKERRLIGYSPAQLYAVVSDVQHYAAFVPWCVRSSVLRSDPDGSYLEAELHIGFQMIQESYTSRVKLRPPHLVSSSVADSGLFHHLESTWRLAPGPRPGCTWLTFSVDFAFANPLYAHLAGLFFTEVVQRMMGAFEGRCAELYGPPAFGPAGGGGGAARAPAQLRHADDAAAAAALQEQRGQRHGDAAAAAAPGGGPAPALGPRGRGRGGGGGGAAARALAGRGGEAEGWAGLPVDCLVSIISRFSDKNEAAVMRAVCRAWRDAFNATVHTVSVHSTILPAASRGFPHLQHLVVSHTSNAAALAAVRLLAQPCAGLCVLELSNSMLSAAPPDLGGLPHLKVLVMTANRIKTLAGAGLHRCEALETLILSNNMLTELPASIGSLGKTLRKLDVSENQLSHLPEGLGGLTGLHTLRASNNTLLELPDSLSQLQALTLLDVSLNRLKGLPALASLTGLRQLGLFASFSHSLRNEGASTVRQLAQLCRDAPALNLHAEEGLQALVRLRKKQLARAAEEAAAAADAAVARAAALGVVF